MCNNARVVAEHTYAWTKVLYDVDGRWPRRWAESPRVLDIPRRHFAPDQPLDVKRE